MAISFEITSKQKQLLILCNNRLNKKLLSTRETTYTAVKNRKENFFSFFFLHDVKKKSFSKISWENFSAKTDKRICTNESNKIIYMSNNTIQRS